MKLADEVNKKKDKYTFVITVLVLLEYEIDCIKKSRPIEGLELKAIRERFNEYARKYNKGRFFNSYVQRHSQYGGVFTEKSDGKFAIKKNLIARQSAQKLIDLRNHILQKFEAIQAGKERVVDSLHTLADSDDKQQQFQCLNNMILQKIEIEGVNKGQLFEVLSFAILSTYFESFGFSLKRFSTTFSNDGGMDFISGDAVYQVTACANQNKINEDLKKLPGTRRVLVVPEKNFDLSKSNFSEILSCITRKDLSNHFLAWLYEQDNAQQDLNYLKDVLVITKNELNRDWMLDSK